MFPRWNSIHVSVFMYIYKIISPTIIVKIFLHIQRWTLIYHFQCFFFRAPSPNKRQDGLTFQGHPNRRLKADFWADVWNRPNWESVRKWWQIQIHEQHETCFFLLMKLCYIYIYIFLRILDVRCTYAINFRDFQRWFLPRTVHVNVNMSWEMYVLFSPCCFVPRFSGVPLVTSNLHVCCRCRYQLLHTLSGIHVSPRASNHWITIYHDWTTTIET